LLCVGFGPARRNNSYIVPVGRIRTGSDSTHAVRTVEVRHAYRQFLAGLTPNRQLATSAPRDSSRRGRFEDLRDAISSARIAEVDRALSVVTVVDSGTGQLVIEVERRSGFVKSFDERWGLVPTVVAFGFLARHYRCFASSRVPLNAGAVGSSDDSSRTRISYRSASGHGCRKSFRRLQRPRAWRP
jgi:hypothetical protein